MAVWVNELPLLPVMVEENPEYAGNSSKDKTSNLIWKRMTIPENVLYTETISRDSPTSTWIWKALNDYQGTTL